MRLAIIGDESHPIILTITNAILGQDESSGLHYVCCHSALHMGEALSLVTVANVVIIIDVAALLAALERI